MAFRAEISPEKLGYKVGAILMALKEGTTDIPENVRSEDGKLQTVTYLWNTNTLDYEIQTVSTGGSGSGSTAVDANLTSIGSTRLVGQFTVANPTTAVNVANPTTSVTVTNPTTVVDLSSNGSTRLVGRVTVDNPTTQVSVSSGVILGAGSSANTIGSVALVAGSTGNTIGAVQQGQPAASSDNAWWVRSVSTGSVSGSTTVDANLTSAGSTKLVGQVELASGSTSRVVGAAVLASGSTAFIAAAVAVSSGVVLGEGSTANSLGAVALLAGSTANTIGAVQQGAPAASSDNAWWVRTVSTGSAGAGSTTVDANQLDGSSAVAPWVFVGMRFSSAQTSHSTFATSAEQQFLAANANRRAVVISNMSTAVELIIGFTTATVSTARANADFLIPANSRLTIGGAQPDVPLYTGPIRGRLNSTTLTGLAAILQFSS